MGKVKEHYHQEIEEMYNAPMADDEETTEEQSHAEVFDIMANRLEKIEDEEEFWAEMRKVEEFYYEKVAA